MGIHSPAREQAQLSRSALHAAAKARAMQLRAEAIDEFWAAIGQGLRAAWRRLHDGARRARGRFPAPRLT